MNPYLGEGERNDLLRKNELDDYIFRLNRHPGRRVDLALSTGAEVGGVTLDYLVAENKSTYVYGQISNTGTRPDRSPAPAVRADQQPAHQPR